MQGLKTKKYIDFLVKEKGIPYLDMTVSRGYGEAFRYFADREGRATGKETLNFFSCTKPMTVACAMRLVEDGRLHLDDPVEKYLPAYADVFLLDDKGNKVAPHGKMTVKHLFTMSGGLTYNTAAPAILKQKELGGGTVDFVNSFIKDPLAFSPGERFEYSLCHDVLAAVVERVCGKRFSKVMEEMIFQPLDMKNTAFHVDEEALADTYCAGVDGKIEKRSSFNELVFSPEYDSGGAGVCGSVEDYAKFARVLAMGGVAENGYRLLKGETVEEIKREQHSTLSVKNTFTCVQGNDYGYGLGMRTRLVPTEWGLPVGEFGWDGAAGTYLMIDPVNRVSVVIGMHLRGWPNVFDGEHLKLVRYAYEDMRAEGIL